MRIEKILTAALFCIATQTTAHAELAPNTIAASGYATVLASPDTASIDIGVVTASPTTSMALRANNAEMAKVVSAIRGLGVPEAQIQTSNFSIDAQHPQGKNGQEDESRTIGYAVTNKLTVTLTDLSKVADVIDAAVRAGANSSNSVSFDVKDRRMLDDQALAQAVRNARHDAEIMAAAEHAKVGRLISVTDDFSVGSDRSFAPVDIALGYRTPILPGQITIAAHVLAVFAIEQSP
jgi:uncharacterized protein YggE